MRFAIIHFMKFLRSAILICLLLILLVHLTPAPIQAAKIRVRSTSTAGKGVAYSSAKLSRNTNSIILTLSNLDKVAKVSYTLSYSASGIEQGAVGSITPSSSTDSRDLYFGTCSKGVCTPHYNIKNASLTVTVSLKTGGTYVKRYKLKV